MKRYFFLIALILGATSSLVAQNLNEYRYIQVPEKFEFLKEDNQYQLNALTAFLFERAGFKTLYKEQIPPGVDPCEVLQTRVHKESNWFQSKVYLTLWDCRNQTVFTSKIGNSKEKEYKRSYQEALREAFQSVEALNYQYSGPTEDPEIRQDQGEEEMPAEVIIAPVLSTEAIAEQTAAEEVIPETKANSVNLYYNGAVSYQLKETTRGYDLYREGEEEKFASLIKSGGGDHYLYTATNISGNAYFDGENNLVVEYLEPQSGQLISIIYKPQAQ